MNNNINFYSDFSHYRKKEKYFKMIFKTHLKLKNINKEESRSKDDKLDLFYNEFINRSADKVLLTRINRSIGIY